MFLGLPDQHPDPLVRGTDPRIRIQILTKMSHIRNTGCGWMFIPDPDFYDFIHPGSRISGPRTTKKRRGKIN
jgi:hypothetical protein